MLPAQRLERFAERFEQDTLRTRSGTTYRRRVGDAFGQALEEDRRVRRRCVLHRMRLHFAHFMISYNIL